MLHSDVPRAYQAPVFDCLQQPSPFTHKHCRQSNLYSVEGLENRVTHLKIIATKVKWSTWHGPLLVAKTGPNRTKFAKQNWSRAGIGGGTRGRHQGHMPPFGKDLPFSAPPSNCLLQ